MEQDIISKSSLKSDKGLKQFDNLKNADTINQQIEKQRGKLQKLKNVRDILYNLQEARAQQKQLLENYEDKNEQICAEIVNAQSDIDRLDKAIAELNQEFKAAEE